MIKSTRYKSLILSGYYFLKFRLTTEPAGIINVHNVETKTREQPMSQFMYNNYKNYFSNDPGSGRLEHVTL